MALLVVEFDLKPHCSFDRMLFSYYMFITILIFWLYIRMFKIFLNMTDYKSWLMVNWWKENYTL